jgi:two-component system response regulator PilR (NtrC family)
MPIKTRLVSMGFPGNIRELENILERAMIICEDEVILAGDLDLHRAGPKSSASAEGRSYTRSRGTG